jgi:acyl transferase domain-containing protein
VASLIKVSLAMKHGVIPETVHFRSPNPGLDLENSPFYVVDKKLDWPSGEPARRAGVSSFGIGGTNSHVILEEAPTIPLASASTDMPFELWPISAKTTPQRDRLMNALPEEQHWPRNVAHTLQFGRARFAHRGARVRLSHLQVDDLLVQPAQAALESPQIAFMFPGQGSQYIEMGKGLCSQLSEFEKIFTGCCEILSAEMNLNFQKFIFDPANVDTLENTRFTQPALFAIEVSLGRMLLNWGIEPAMMLGHSIGEFVAAHLAGVFTLEEALKLITARGRLMSDLPRGQMLSVRGELDAVLAAAGEPVDIASINGPVHYVLSGSNEQVERVRARLEAAGIACRTLHTSHAFHSNMMTPVVEPFLEVVRGVCLQRPERNIISTVTGEPLTDSQATDPQYWSGHLRKTVRFSPALFRSMELGANVFLEVGPRTTLTSLAVQHFVKAPKGSAECVSIAMLGDKPDAQTEIGGVGSALARLWCAGVELPWQKIWGDGLKVPLVSTYPFERKDYRFSEGRHAEQRVPARVSEIEEGPHSSAGSIRTEPMEAGAEERLCAELCALFSDYSGLPIDRFESTFVECGFDSLLLMQIGVELSKSYGATMSLRDLMETQNTPARLAKLIITTAPPKTIRHLFTVPVENAKPVAAPVRAASGEAADSAKVRANLPQAGTALSANDFIDAQLGRTNRPPAHVVEVREAVAPAEARTRSRISGGANGHALAPSGKPLIRAIHKQPPERGAFRGTSAAGDDAWFIYDSGKRRYGRSTKQGKV